MAWTFLPLRFFPFLFLFYFKKKDDHHHSYAGVREQNKQWMNEWMDGWRSFFGVSFFSVVSACMCVCVYFHSSMHPNSLTHAHTLTHRERNKKKTRNKRIRWKNRAYTMNRWIWIMKQVNLLMLMPTGQSTSNHT
jgi:uncharacterized membrane protein